MSAARLLIKEVERISASFRLEGDRLRLIPAPGKALPAPLVARAKAERDAILAALLEPSFASPEKAVETWEECAAHLEYDAGLPRAWAEHFARLIVGEAPGDFSPTRWQAALDGALRFADRWAKEAHRLGWDASEVFGLDDEAPATRIDHRGLAWLLGHGGEVVALDRDGAEIRTAQGGRQRFYRRRGVRMQKARSA